LMKYIMNRGTVSRKLLSKARFMQLLNAFLARPASRLI
jgi:hypothetical protein